MNGVACPVHALISKPLTRADGLGIDAGLDGEVLGKREGLDPAAHDPHSGQRHCVLAESELVGACIQGMCIEKCMRRYIQLISSKAKCLAAYPGCPASWSR